MRYAIVWSVMSVKKYLQFVSNGIDMWDTAENATIGTLDEMTARLKSLSNCCSIVKVG